MSPEGHDRDGRPVEQTGSGRAREVGGRRETSSAWDRQAIREDGPGDSALERRAEPLADHPPRRRRLRWLALGCISLLALALACGAAWLWITYPDVAGLSDAPPQSTAFIDAAASQGRVAWSWVAGSRISPELRKAVVAAEDMSFFSHRGFDQHEIEVAIREALEGGRVRGASTITQQLAKNLWLSPSRNPLRKVREALYTRSLERHLSKRRILDIYVNVVEFGPGVYGAQAAATQFFGKAATALSADEAAQLAAALPSSRWYPGSDSRAYQSHVRRVRQRMREADWLNQLVD